MSSARKTRKLDDSGNNFEKVRRKEDKVKVLEQCVKCMSEQLLAKEGKEKQNRTKNEDEFAKIHNQKK